MFSATKIRYLAVGMFDRVLVCGGRTARRRSAAREGLSSGRGRLLFAGGTLGRSGYIGLHRRHNASATAALIAPPGGSASRDRSTGGRRVG